MSHASKVSRRLAEAVAPEVIVASIAPVAKACDNSAACTVTGWALTKSAMRAVAGLYARHFTPRKSATDAMGFLV